MMPLWDNPYRCSNCGAPLPVSPLGRLNWVCRYCGQYNGPVRVDAEPAGPPDVVRDLVPGSDRDETPFPVGRRFSLSTLMILSIGLFIAGAVMPMIIVGLGKGLMMEVSPVVVTMFQVLLPIISVAAIVLLLLGWARGY